MNQSEAQLLAVAVGQAVREFIERLIELELGTEAINAVVGTVHTEFIGRVQMIERDRALADGELSH